MENILKDVDNVMCFFDDILIYSKTEKDHAGDLDRVMKKITGANLKLNEGKCEFRKKEIEFLGHIITKDGVKPDPEKVAAILNMPDPNNVTELRRTLGMINYLGRYISNLSTILWPVTELLEKDQLWFLMLAHKQQGPIPIQFHLPNLPQYPATERVDPLQ
ncbi:hypothetical protein ACOMHN_034608 [Nucella lapillus]